MGVLLKAGDLIGGKYVLRELLGEGGMGIVYLADQPALARTVAIKVLHPRFSENESIARRFREEAVAASRVRHPACVTVIDCNQLADGTPYIVMEHVSGRPLGRIVSEEDIPVPRACAIVEQILAAIDAIHAAGVIHADIKSDNFLVQTTETGDHVTAIDFGLARIGATFREHGVDGVPSVSGTPEYMAPEIVRGEAPTVATDLYAVGVILYELLTGTTPFGGGSPSEIMQRHLDDLVIPPSLRQPERDIPSALDQIVLRAMAKEPKDRYGDATELARALRMASRALIGRPSRPSLHDHADATSVTQPFKPKRRIARGSDAHAGGEELGSLRRSIGDAILRGDISGIAAGYVDLAMALARNHHFAAALRELEEGLDVVTGGRGVATPGLNAPVDQLVVGLAALYEEAGERDRARRLAAAADRHPTLGGPQPR